MKRYASVALFCASLSGAPAFASGDCKFLKKVGLPERQTAVIATGDLEACSLGSYSVRIYSSENVQPGDDTTFYRFGLLHERDGTVEDAFLANLGPSAPASLIVKIRSVGSGGHVSARAYVVKEGLQKSWHSRPVQLSWKNRELVEEKSNVAAGSWPGSVNQAHAQAGISR
jgi:hypothetical protein